MTKKRSGKKKVDVESTEALESPNTSNIVPAEQPKILRPTPQISKTQPPRRSLLPADLFREIELLKLRVAELEKKLS